MTPKPERKRPPASTGLQRGRLTAEPEQLKVGDSQPAENQTPEVPDSQTPENQSGGLWGRIAEMRAGSDAPEPQTPAAPEQPPRRRTGRAPDPGSPGHPQPRSTEVPHSETPGVRDFSTSRVRDSGSAESQSPRVPQSPSPEAASQPPERPLPRYLTLERSEARLRGDQMVALAALRKRVAANRTVKSERITDNTLLRVAVDLLLSQGGQLHGNTEEELRASLGIVDDDETTD